MKGAKHLFLYYLFDIVLFFMITKEELLDMADIARLYINEDQLESITKDMNNIISFSEMINELDVKGEEFHNINDLSNRFRKDVVEPSYSRDEVFANTNIQQDGYFMLNTKS